MPHSAGRVLVVSRDAGLYDGLTAVLAGRDFFVDYAKNRQDAARQFRSHKQHLVILDFASLGKAPRRLFRYIRRVRKNTITVVAAARSGEYGPMAGLDLDADALLDLSGNFPLARSTLDMAMESHRTWMRNLFLKHVAFFAALVLPMWLGLLWVVLRD